MSDVVYEDSFIKIKVDDDPITTGHLTIYPVQEVAQLEELPTDVIAYMYEVANKCATFLFEGLKAHGTNIILYNGPNTHTKVHIAVIARTDGDGLDLHWQPQQGDPAKVNEMAAKLKSALVIGEQKKTIPQVQQTQTKQQSVTDNIYYHELRRLP